MRAGIAVSPEIQRSIHRLIRACRGLVCTVVIVLVTSTFSPRAYRNILCEAGMVVYALAFLILSLIIIRAQNELIATISPSSLAAPPVLRASLEASITRLKKAEGVFLVMTKLSVGPFVIFTVWPWLFKFWVYRK